MVVLKPLRSVNTKIILRNRGALSEMDVEVHLEQKGLCRFPRWVIKSLLRVMPIRRFTDMRRSCCNGGIAYKYRARVLDTKTR